jgi:hypothetical protein
MPHTANRGTSRDLRNRVCPKKGNKKAAKKAYETRAPRAQTVRDVLRQLQVPSALQSEGEDLGHAPPALLTMSSAGDSRSGWIRYFLFCRALASPTACRFNPGAVRIARYPTRIGSGDPANGAASRSQVVSITEGRRAAPSEQSAGRRARGPCRDLF